MLTTIMLKNQDYNSVTSTVTMSPLCNFLVILLKPTFYILPQIFLYWMEKNEF